MSGKAKQPAVTSAEEARAAARELHEAIKDAKTATREIGDAIGEWGDNAQKMKDAANSMLEGLAEQISSEIREIGALLHEHADGLRQAHAEALGAKDPDEVINLVMTALLPAVERIIVRSINLQLPGIVAMRMAAAGELADLLQSTPGPAYSRTIETARARTGP